MAYEKVNNRGGGDGVDPGLINKWTVTGQTAEGGYEGMREGKFGKLIQIGGRTWAGHTVLVGALKDIPVGTLVKVEYLGKVRGQSGVEYNNFDVYKDTGSTVPVQLPPPSPFDELCRQIAAEKGQVIADALKTATRSSSDPLEALRDAAKQVGVEALPF